MKIKQKFNKIDWTKLKNLRSKKNRRKIENLKFDKIGLKIGHNQKS